MKLRWKKETDGELTLQYFNPLDWRDNGEHWENVPIFESYELKTIEKAIAAEREWCAKLVENGKGLMTIQDIANAIRKGSIL